jgi:molybdopterin-guanine dinucleotide biosynthesis protein B
MPSPRGRRPPVVSVVGPAGAGKTALLEALVPALARRGYRVACLKHSHHRGLLPESPDSDSYRLARAGPQATALAAPGLLCLRRADDGEWPLPALLPLLQGLVDVVLTEGYHQAPTPKLLVLRPGQQPLPFRGRLLAVVGDAPPRWRGPRFSPHQAEALAAFLEQRLALNRGGRR